MAIRAVIFDLYGVLGLNGWQEFKTLHFGGRWESWETLRQLGQKVDAGLVTDDVFVNAIATATGEPADTVRYQFEHTQPNTELLRFIRDELRGTVKIGLLSNASQDVLPGIFNEQDQALFDAIVMSLHTGRTKPDTSMFTLICEKLGIKPSECIMVDDQERHLAVAADLGMKTVLYDSAEQVGRTVKEMLEDD